MSEFIEIDGHQIEIDQQIVDPKRPTLVFLHEGLGSVSTWRDFPAKVAEATGCNRLVYSRLGCGQSDPAKLPRTVRYMHDEALSILPAILAKLDIGKHILIGHSDGGSIALINGGGVRSPDLLGLITEAAHVFTEPISVQSIEAAREAYQTADLRQKLAKHHADVDHAFWGWNDIWLHPGFLHWNIEEYLPTIEVPVLVIQGLDDQYGTLAQVEAIGAGIGDSVTATGSGQVQIYLIPNCQHVPHYEQREATFAAMTAFIKQLTNEFEDAKGVHTH